MGRTVKRGAQRVGGEQPESNVDRARQYAHDNSLSFAARYHLYAYAMRKDGITPQGWSPAVPAAESDLSADDQAALGVAKSALGGE